MNDIRKWMRLVEGVSPEQNANFKQWFGASQVVAADGRPLVVYHGSNAHAYVGGAIDIFHTLPASGRGAAFFSSSKNLAGEYGEKLYSVYLRIENPLIVFGDGKNWAALDHTVKLGGRVTDALRTHHHKRAQQLDAIFRDLDGGGADDTPTPSRIPDHVGELDGYRLDIIPDMEGNFIETDIIVKQARRLGYDGVIFKAINDSPTHDRYLYKNTPTDVYAVFQPGQIKAIDNNGAWNRADPDINA